MKISRHITYVFFLISFVLMSACEQDTSLGTDDSSRITLGPNVHDKVVGNYVIHVNALTTDQLPAEVARGYNISRSKNRAMLNVAVREKSETGETPVTAKVDIVVKNLSNQLKDIKLREIIEDDPLAIYYIGEVPVNHEETLVFNLDVMPAGANEAALLSYRQRFFTE